MKSSSRTDENLIKRAKYGGRNVRAIAILLSIFAGLLLAAVAITPASMTPGFGFEWFAIAFICIAVGLWMLAIMTLQGDRLGLSILLCWFGILLILNIVGVLIIYAKGDPALYGLPPVAVQLLILVVLVRNRSDLIELQRRGLSESAFGPGRPPRHLTVLGGVVLIGGQIAAVAAMFAPLVNAAQTVAECHDFLLMINVEEQAVKQAMGKPIRPADKQFWANVLDAAEKLRDKAQQVESQASQGSPIKLIAEIYLRAAEQWRAGAADALAAGRMTQKARAAFQAGDNLRDEAYAEFQRKFPGIGQRPK